MSHTWIIDLGATDHMTENQDIMFSFTPDSKSVVLVNGSRAPIQGIGTAVITPTLYHLFSIYLVFLLTYYE